MNPLYSCRGIAEDDSRNLFSPSMNKIHLSFSVLVLIDLLLSACGGGSGPAAGPVYFGSSDLAAPELSVAPAGTFVPQGSSDWPLFVYPQPGDPNVDPTHPVMWTAATNARGYQLQIGTTVGGNDVFDSGIISTTSVAMPPLPTGVLIYARVRAVLNGWGDALPAGHWPIGSYTRFRTDDQTPASSFTNVAADGTLPAGMPLEWSASPLAVGYRIGIGSSYSGVIYTTHAIINTPVGASLTVSLETIYLTGTVSSQMIITFAGGVSTFADRYALAEELAADVRNMADVDNQPYGLTALDTTLGNLGLSVANCGNFTTTLSQLMAEANAGLNARQLDIELESYDTHTLLEVLDDTSNRWDTLDPTFGLITLDSNGSPATSAEISAAVRAQNWTSLHFQYLTAAGSLYANDYYIDYPLLFMDVVAPSGSALVQAPPATLAPYFEAFPLPISAAQAAYSLQCAPGFDSANAIVNAATLTMTCGGSDQLTGAFWADTIQAAGEGTSTSAAWRLRRFVF